MKKLTPALKLHLGGKLAIQSKIPIQNDEELALAYTPGVAEPCLEIQKNTDKAYSYTFKGNSVAIISDGTAVLGLGNIGAQAALPVMEGKAILFKQFADIDAFPLCINCQDPEELVEIIEKLTPSFGGINLEDLSAPHCFYVEEELKKRCNIPIFHDDQHGTAITILACLLNATTLAEKDLKKCKIVINGAGAAGIAAAFLLKKCHVDHIIVCDTKGAIYEGRKEHMHAYKEKLASVTNPEKEKGSLQEVLRDADIFIGVSKAGLVSQKMIRSMNNKPIVLALANPVPEIMPDEAKEGGAFIVCTGRSDFPNQVNNVLTFPGIFRGALDAHASDITYEMQLAAAYTLANIIPKDKLSPDYVIPHIFNPLVAKMMADSVKKAAKKSGVARNLAL